MKELLDMLEERVTALVRENQSLRQQNDDLRREMAEQTGPLAAENQALQDALAQEKAVKEEAAQRIDALLQRLTAPTEE